MGIDKEPTGTRLGRLARIKGLELEYHDIRGRVHTASEETLKTLLRAMGLKVDTAEEIDGEILREEQKEWRPLTHPVLVENLSRIPEELVFQIPAPEGRPAEQWIGSLQVKLAIEEENGYQRMRVFSPEEIRIRESGQLDEVRFQQFGVPFPRDLPLGSHHLRLTASLAEETYDQAVTLIVCPDKTYKPSVLRSGGRRAGLAVALPGLRSLRNWGIGDLGDLKDLTCWAAEELKVDPIGLLPLHALGNREPYNISPYYPSSRFYRNYIYLEVPGIEEVKNSPEIQGWIGSVDVQQRIERLRNSDWVEYEAAAGLKLEALEKAFQAFLANHWEAAGPESGRSKAFQAFRLREGEFLERFAVFCALEESFRLRPPFPQIWQDWPAPFQDPNSEEVREFKRTNAERVLFHQYLQWQLEEQLQAVQQAARDSGAAIGLYFDLALGVDPCGADAWAYRDFFISGMRAGAPPDDFSPLGQEWGFQPSDRERHRADGYRLLKQEIRKNCFPGGALRIDHVMRYRRLFWIPEGRKPADGAYVRDYFHDLVRVLSLESVQNRTLIIGEDLGTVPEEVREVLHRRGVFSYRLFYFEKDAGGKL